MVKEFILNQREKIVGHWQKTRNGFRHLVEFIRDGGVIESRSVSYLNRTWESYEYETAIRELLRKMVKNRQITQEQAEHYAQITAGRAKADLDARLGSIAMVAKMGELFADTKEDQNKWKLRMIKAGMGEGVQLPPDWDELSEEEKERRLNRIIEEFRRK